MKSWRTKRWVVSSLALAAASALLAGCGGASAGGGASDASTIKIGVTAALSGHGVSLWGESAKIPKVWEQYINAKGGINGHKVEVFVVDSKSDPAAGASVAQDLVQNKKVAAVITLDTQAEASVASYLQSAKVPLLGVNFIPTIAERPNVFNVTTGLTGYVPGVVHGAKLDGKSKFGVLHCNESPSCAAAADIYHDVAPGLGIEYIGGLGVNADAPNYTAACLSLIQKGTDFIELDTSAAGQVRMARDCVAQGFRGSFGAVASAVNIDMYRDVKGATFIGSINAFPWWVDDAPVVEYREAIKRYDPSVKYQASAPAAAWTTLQLFAKAMENSDDLSPAGVSKAMGTIRDETLGGLLAEPVTLDPSKPTKSPQCFWLMKYVAGDEGPTLLAGSGSGNGATGGLKSTCLAK